MATRISESVHPLSGSALNRAIDVGARAARIGFDWPDAQGPLGKVAEEVAELQEAFHAGNRKHIECELGDVLFAAVNLARHLRINPEVALDGTCERFSDRLEWVRSALAARGLSLRDVQPEERESLWQEAKKA
ncbi:MAG: hypothetical protein KTR25_13715 [Myxococcales bacterium]|nr:hypothetical protein [Myxococcales bacterium]